MQFEYFFTLFTEPCHWNITGGKYRQKTCKFNLDVYRKFKIVNTANLFFLSLCSAFLKST